ncbi:hypothetical protein QLS71_001420 [Mariniflexile litorale]|uniref:DUF4412 domain-containing protein n=1 Tax=Mariniflexile litorale TaxID=3045158 RepID=A0AAU7EHU2_9FLAO|nr:hypothetical protein [Mariniflexile sp. KMM 9835]MDQ8210874.1 hypothetical protein [Mariniflexile sp. KMM 9835]
MTKIILIAIGCLLYNTGQAQGHIPEITNNTELQYICKLYGQTRPVNLRPTFVGDTLIIDWDLRKTKRTYAILPEALQNGTGLTFNQGESPDLLVLEPTDTFFMISKSAFSDLVANNKFVYNNTTYNLDKTKVTNEVVIDGKIVDVLFVKAEIDETELWILNNPEFPLICKIAKNPLGVNCTLTEIVNN